MRFASQAQLERAFAMLTACAYSGFMLTVAPIELWQVRAAPARLIASGGDYLGMEPGDGPSVWYQLGLSDGRTVERSNGGSTRCSLRGFPVSHQRSECRPV